MSVGHDEYYSSQERVALESYVEAGLDEGLLSLTPSDLLCMENPYSYKKYR